MKRKKALKHALAFRSHVSTVKRKRRDAMYLDLVEILCTPKYFTGTNSVPDDVFFIGAIP